MDNNQYKSHYPNNQYENEDDYNGIYALTKDLNNESQSRDDDGNPY